MAQLTVRRVSPEVVGALKRRAAANGRSAEAEHRETLRAAPISLPVPMLQLTPAAARLADDLDHPVHDCFYLALAVQTQYPVVTADMRFHDKVRAHPYLSDLIVHVADTAANGTAE